MMEQVMKMQFRKYALLLLAPILVACSSQSAPDRYYLLSSQNQSAAIVSTTAPVVGIGPVTIPSHLDRSVIVTRSSANRLEVNTGHRWAEPLEENVNRVLMDNLDRAGKVSRLETFPWTSRDGVDFQIVVDIDRFERQADGNAVLVARWKLVDFQSGAIIHSAKYSKNSKPVDSTIENTVVAMSTLLSDMSSEIAGYIP
ncbi:MULTISPECIES: PqiC family protein [Thalassospira]|nr:MULTISPECIES: PqiC family protein [Thalassospira]MDG4721007.1 PqiC family protein [Thalassospira sp. FZY0004]